MHILLVKFFDSANLANYLCPTARKKNQFEQSNEILFKITPTFEKHSARLKEIRKQIG
jgi:hypothetical protein